jgi:hypothetical protein
MVDLTNPDHITLLFSILGGIGTFFSLLWMKMIKPAMKLMSGQEEVFKSLDTIKKELTTNGGNSLKDSINDLKNTVNKMDKRQIVIEQRTKASLHYHSAALFETDSQGRLVWTNNNFFELTQDVISDVDGYNWLNYIEEKDREKLFNELKSCLEMNRELVKTVSTVDSKLVKMIGFPYKINEKEQGGFLISISIIKEI